MPIEKMKDILVLGLVLAGLFSILTGVLYVLGAAEESANLTTFMFYGVVALFSFIGIACGRILFGSRKETASASPIVHDPDRGLFGKFEFVRNPWKLFKISFLIFFALGMFSAQFNTFFSDAPELQVQPAAEVIIASEPAAFAETLMFYAFFFPLLTGLFHIKIFKGRWLLPSVLMAGLIVGFILFPAWHFFVYGNAEINVVKVIIGGLAQVSLVAITGSIIPGALWHSFGNGFLKLKKFMGSDAILIYGFAFLLILGIIFVITWGRKRSKRVNVKVVQV